MPRLFSYAVRYGTGFAPNPYRGLTGIGRMLQDRRQIAQSSWPILYILVNSIQLARVQHCLGLFAVVYRYCYSHVVAVGLQHV